MKRNLELSVSEDQNKNNNSDHHDENCNEDYSSSSSGHKKFKLEDKAASPVLPLLFELLSEECFELVLQFLCMKSVVVKKPSHDVKKVIVEREDKKTDHVVLKLQDEKLQSQLSVQHVIFDWQALKTLSQVSRNIFSKCIPFMIDYEAKKLINHVFDNTSDFYRPVEAQLELFNLRNKSNELKTQKAHQWEMWFRGGIYSISSIPCVETQNELKEKILNRASYSFQNSNKQKHGRWEGCAYCHLLDDLHLYHDFTSSYEDCGFTISIFGDLDQVNKSIKKEIMKYLVLPDVSFYSEMSDCDEECDEKDDKDFKSYVLMDSFNCSTSKVYKSILNHVREKLGITCQVTDKELVAALVYIFPYDITGSQVQVEYGESEFVEQEEIIDFTGKNSEKVNLYHHDGDHDSRNTNSSSRGECSIFNVGHDMLLHIFEFLRFRYVATLSETNKTFYNIYLKSGWSFPIRMRKIIDSYSQFMNKTSIEKSLTVIRNTRYYSYSEHPPFVQYLSVRYASIDYLNSVHTVMKVGKRKFTFSAFDDEGGSPYFAIDDITDGDGVEDFNNSPCNDFICSDGNLRVKTKTISLLEDLFGKVANPKSLVKGFLDLLPFTRDSNWLYVSNIIIGD